MKTLAQIQLGKGGLTPNFIKTLKSHFEKHKNVKIKVLKSCCRDKQELEKMIDKILEELGKKYTARAIGYTITIKKWRTPREE